jgi:hypothetical protein
MGSQVKYDCRPIIERFTARVGPRTIAGCMEWQGTFINSGYGYLGSRQTDVRLAHRAAWFFVHGRIPSGMHVMHKCDNKRCVNVEHLQLGTRKDNMQDSSLKGRAKKTKLSAEQQAEIFSMRASGALMREIAARFHVSRPMVSLILSGKVKSVRVPLRTPVEGECHFE